MTYWVLASFVVSIIHFVYQSIVAPSLRADLRERLLRLSDELHGIASADRVNQRCIVDLRQSQARLLEAFDRISLVALLEVERELRNDRSLREQVDARSASFDRCVGMVLRSLRARTIRIALQVVAINNGGLILSILPAMPFLLASGKFRNWLLRLAVQAIDFHQQLGPAYVRVKHDELRL